MANPYSSSPNPNANAGSDYLRAKVMTATPEQLQLMMFDGAIRFAEQAKLALDAQQFDRSHDRLSKSQAIVSELINGLKPDVLPEVTEKLMALYSFAYRRLIDANLNREVGPVDDALRVLKYQRETWVLLMQQTAEAKREAGETALPSPSEPAAKVERLSIAA